MRATVLIVVFSAVAGSAAAAEEIELPELGTKRRVVLSEMRSAHLSLLDSSGSRLDFLGGPPGLEDASTTSFHFDDVTLDEIRLSFPRHNSSEETKTFFRSLQARLSNSFGSPQVDHSRPRHSTEPRVVVWGYKGTTLTLRGDRYNDVTLVVSLGTVGGPPAGRVFRASDDVGHAAWAPDQFNARVTNAKRAVDDLLDALDQEPFMRWARKNTSRPISMRLKHVSVAQESGIDRELVQLRFAYFVRGSYDLVLAKRRPDIDVEIDIKPSPRMVDSSYDVVVVARATRGKARNHVLFTRSTTIQ